MPSIIPMHERIFCNRSLNVESIKAVGFDMDYTLALYKPFSFETLVFAEILKKMVANGYPSDILSWTFEPTAMIRGLVIDKKRGNILKLDRHNYVKVAYHGFKELLPQERRTLYDGIAVFKEPEFSFLDTFFTLVEAYLVSKLVEYKDTHSYEQKSYEDFCLDVRKYLDASHRDDALKNLVAQNPSQYVYFEPDLADVLLTLKQMGKKLFLLTNSVWNYVDRIMGYLLPINESKNISHWTDYFDIIVVDAKKPHFFSSTAQMLDGPMQKVFVHGDAQQLHSMLSVSHGAEVLYVGDHIYGDVVRSKKNLGWRTMLLIGELENELCSQNPHPVWGALLKTGNHNSFFSGQVSRYACLYTSKIVNFKYYHEQKRFNAVPDLLPHEQ